MSTATVIASTQTFTAEQSSAIASVRVEGNQVTLAFQSNPDAQYTYSATDSFIEELESVVGAEVVEGLGSLVAAGRRSGDLQEVTA
jgi:phage-related protein